jgi:hypothetical protein
MAHITSSQHRIDANDNDIKNNRLGLMSQSQVDQLQHDIDGYQTRIREIIQRAIGVGVMVTLGIITLVLIRVLRIPIALILEVFVVGGMIYLTTDFNRFIQQLIMDKEAGAVRIIKGRVSRYTMRSHPLYQTLRVEVQNYKVRDISSLRQFENGELYQVYVLPHSRLVISAEKISESGAGALI